MKLKLVNMRNLGYLDIEFQGKQGKSVRSILILRGSVFFVFLKILAYFLKILSLIFQQVSKATKFDLELKSLKTQNLLEGEMSKQTRSTFFLKIYANLTIAVNILYYTVNIITAIL